MTTNDRSSYTAADSIPMKLITDIKTVESITNGIIPPIHAQFIPTNKCNLKCPFCSCAEDDRMTEMSLENAKKIIYNLAKCGCKAVTITGGGEPIIHPNFKEIVEEFIKYGIAIGLVSNGLLLSTIDTKTLNKITWCRISNGDFRSFNTTYEKNIRQTIRKASNVDWAFSHVVSTKPNYEEIARLVNFANDEGFTHMRLVADLFETKKVPLDKVKEYLKEQEIDDSLVIYQGRKEPEKGMDCRIGFLKPLIGADCKVYACCGVQYALKVPSKKLPQTLCLGHAFDLPSIMANSNKPFINGNKCFKCYYGNYNRILAALQSPLNHKEFI